MQNHTLLNYQYKKWQKKINVHHPHMHQNMLSQHSEVKLSYKKAKATTLDDHTKWVVVISVHFTFQCSTVDLLKLATG